MTDEQFTIGDLRGVADKHFGESLTRTDPAINSRISIFLDRSMFSTAPMGGETAEQKTALREKPQIALCVELMDVATAGSGLVTEKLAAQCFAENSKLPKSWFHNPEGIKSLLTTMANFEVVALQDFGKRHPDATQEMNRKADKLIAFVKEMGELGKSVGEGQLPTAKR